MNGAATLPAFNTRLENPLYIDLPRRDLAWNADGSFVKALAGEGLAVREAIVAKLAALRRELLGENLSPIEMLLAERAVACWLLVQDVDLRYAQNQEQLSIRQADYHQRRMDAANRR